MFTKINMYVLCLSNFIVYLLIICASGHPYPSESIAGHTFLNKEENINLTGNNQSETTQFEQAGFSEGELKIDHKSQPSNTVSDKASNTMIKDKGGTKTFEQFNSNPDSTISKSSVVARKGAEMEQRGSTVIDTHTSAVVENNHTVKIFGKTVSTNVTSNSSDNKIIQTIKKPESASDITEDPDGRFSFFESSTGKDYVLTGIAIFICIWAVIFGGLFFYKRAGEIWDRRHYRRMDFLVEGMYND